MQGRNAFLLLLTLLLSQVACSDNATPNGAVEAYLAAMARHDSSPDHPFYSRASQQLLRSWKVTDRQMDNLVTSYRHCGHAETIESGSLAVVRYAPTRRRCSPWFLRNEGGQWRLELSAQQKLLRFGHHNAWHFAGNPLSHAWGFAFEDWRFDSNGFPQPN